MILGWEHRKRDRVYLSVPVERGARYRIRSQGSKWMAHRIGWGRQPLDLSPPHVFVGSFDSAGDAMRACQARDAAGSCT